MGGEADYKEPTNGAKRAIALALTGFVLAGLGWADAYERGRTLTAYKAELAAAGLDPANAGALKTSLAASRRALTDVENAIVSASAAQAHRTRAVEQLSARTAALETEADALGSKIRAFGVDAQSVQSVSAGIAAKTRQLRDVENALVATAAAQAFRATQLAALTQKSEAAAVRLADADAKADALEAENRVLGPKVVTFQNEVVAAEAAAKARQAELNALVADVERNRALVEAATAWSANNAALTRKNEDLTRQQVDLENRVTSLISAVAYRQAEISKVMVAMNDADGERQTAMRETLAYRAETRKLTNDIGALIAERKAVEAALIDVNNRFVPALAAVKTREAQLEKLVQQVAAEQTVHERLSDQNTTMQARLQETDDRLLALAGAARTAAQHLAEIDKLLEKPTVQAALSQN